MILDAIFLLFPNTDTAAIVTAANSKCTDTRFQFKQRFKIKDISELDKKSPNLTT